MRSTECALIFVLFLLVVSKFILGKRDILPKIKYIGQAQETECGLCCTAMILNYLGYKVSLTELENKHNIGRDGLSFKEIGNILAEYNYECSYYKVTSFPYEKIQKKFLPMVILWNENHFVILERITKQHFYIVDPNYGRLRMTRAEFESHFSHLVLVPQASRTGLKRRNNKSEWSIYKEFLGHNKIGFFYVFIIAIAYYLFTMILPMIMQNVTNLALEKNTQLVERYVFLLIIAIPIFFLVYWLRSKAILKLSLKMDRFTYSRLMNILFNVSYDFFLNRNSSDLLYKISLSRANRDLLLDTVIEGILDLGMVVLINVLFFFKNRKVFVMMLAFSLILTVALLSLKEKIVQKNKNEIMEASKLQGLEYESLSAIFTIKGSSQENYVEKLIMNQYFRSIDKYKKRYKLNIFYGNLTETISLFCPLLLFVFTLSMRDMSVGESIYVYSLSGIYFGSVSSVFSSWNTLGTIKNNMERINSVLEQKVQQLPSNLGTNIETIDSLVFDHVFYKYPGQTEFALKNVSFEIKKGEKVSLVGKTGAGKSTLLGLVLCLYSPTKGRILVNGIDIKEINTERYKKLLGFVPQQSFIFNKSIKDNILMNREYSLSKVEKVCKVAAIKDDIDNMPMKFDTIIAELGRNISGGQKQRITIARALISDPQILLLDEATSSVDNVTEKKISSSLRLNKVTQINVAHRLSTIRDSDKIIVISNSHVSAIGTHEELLSKNMVYSNLYRNEG